MNWLQALPVAIFALYLWAALRERRWSGWRMLFFAAGCMALAGALSPAVAQWAHHDLRGHMVQHLLLGMFAPLGLVMGAPGLLLLRTVPVGVARGLMGVAGALPVRVLVHPVTAAVLDIGGMYVLYLTPLYALSLEIPALHLWLHLHFLVAGYLFTWSIAGPDPAPHRPSWSLRLWVLFLASAGHGMLAKIMYGYGYPAGAVGQEAAAQWMYYGGDLAGILLTVALFHRWFRSRRRLSPVPASSAGWS